MYLIYILLNPELEVILTVSKVNGELIISAAEAFIYHSREEELAWTSLSQCTTLLVVILFCFVYSHRITRLLWMVPLAG